MNYYIKTPTQKIFNKIVERAKDRGHGVMKSDFWESFKEKTVIGVGGLYLLYCDEQYYRKEVGVEAFIEGENILKTDFFPGDRVEHKYEDELGKIAQKEVAKLKEEAKK